MTSSPAACEPVLRVDSPRRPRSVRACSLDPDLIGVLENTAGLDNLLASVFRVFVAEALSPGADDLPDVSGRYHLCDDEVWFIPTFPFDTDVKYCAIFDARLLGFRMADEPSTLEFVIPSDKEPASTEVSWIFPSGDVLPENLLRFYVCFSSSMQRGRALDEISLLDADEQPVADALYRAPVELWDRTMRRLTVLLDPGRLKRWVGPNRELGPPLKVGRSYTLEIGSGMIDQHGRPLRERFRKHFGVGDPVREQVSVESWELRPPLSDGRDPLVLLSKSPLDWALLMGSIRVRSEDGLAIAGQVVVDQSEKRWSFTPASPWTVGAYQIHVDSTLEDVCGNNVAGAFDRPLREKDCPGKDANDPSLFFQLT